MIGFDNFLSYLLGKGNSKTAQWASDVVINLVLELAKGCLQKER